MAVLNPSQMSLGTSLALDRGDLVLKGTSLLMVEQLAALAQALRTTLETQLGTDRINRTHGFDRLAALGSTYGVHTRKELVKLQLVSAVGRDRRVKDVKEIFFNDEPRYFDVLGISDPAERQRQVNEVHAKRAYSVYLVIDTVLGELRTGPVGGSLG